MGASGKFIILKNHTQILDARKLFFGVPGQLRFFYHSVKEKSIVGIVEVIKEYYPDHTDAKDRFGMVDVKAVQALPTPVTLAEIKAERELESLALIRQSRLSVVPIDAASWKHICKMGKL